MSGTESKVRAAFLPIVTVSNIERDSDYVWNIKTARKMRERGHFSYILVDEKFKDSVVDEDGIKHLFFRDVLTYNRMMNFMPDMSELLSHINGKYFIDVIVSSRRNALLFARTFLNSNLSPMHTLCLDSIVRRLQFKLDEKVSAMYFSEFPTVFSTSHEVELARKWSNEYGMEFKSKNYVIPCGIDVELAKKYWNVEKFDDFTVFFGGRINPEKDFLKITKIIESAYRLGIKANYIITTPSSGVPKEMESRLDGIVKFYTSCSRELYLELFSKSHLSLCCSPHESYTFGFSGQASIHGLSLYPNEP